MESKGERSMENATDYLDRLPRMTPVDEPAVFSGAGGVRRGFRMTKQELVIVSGVVLILSCGPLLFFVYGLASMVPPDDPLYWSHVLATMFGLKYGGWVAIPSSFGLLLGIGLVLLGIFKLNSLGRNV
jgi:hypothetical protein